MEGSLLHAAWSQIWQVTLLVIVVGVLTRLLMRNRPHLAYVLWLVVLVKCLTPPLLTSASGVFCWLRPVVRVVEAEPAAVYGAVPLVPPPDEFIVPLYPLEDVSVSTVVPPATTEPPRPGLANVDWAACGLLVWAIGASVSLGMSIWQWRACLHRARRKRCEPGPEVAGRVEGLARRLGLRRRVRLLVTQGRLGPAVTGVFRPTLLMPAGLLEKQSEELEPLLAHELIHIRRGDLWAGLLQTIVLALWWFHPPVRWGVRESMREGERCCDEAVLAALGCRPRDYARSLLDVLEYKMEWAPAPAFPGAGRIDATAKRLERIMSLGHGCRSRTPWWCWLVMLAAAAVVLPGGAFVASVDKATADDHERTPAEEGTAGEEQGGDAEISNSVPTGDEADKAPLLAITYTVADVLSEIERSGAGRDDAKKTLMKLCGFNVDGANPRGGQSRVAWMDDMLVAMATRAEHDTIAAELEAVREHGLCSLEIEVLCLTGPEAVIQEITQSGVSATESAAEVRRRDDGESHFRVEAKALTADLDDVVRRLKGNPEVRILASPRLRVHSGWTASVRIGGEVPYGAADTGPSVSVGHVPVGLEMRFEPRLRTNGRLLLHSAVKWSEVVTGDGDSAEQDSDESSAQRDAGIVSYSASSVSLQPVGKTVAIETRADGGGTTDSRNALFLVRVKKVAQDDTSTARRGRVQKCWAMLGLRLEAIEKADWERDFNTRYRGGLRITRVRPDSPAAEEHLRVGDILVGLHTWETTSLKNIEFVLSRRYLDQISPLKFYVLRDNETLYGHLSPATKSHELNGSQSAKETCARTYHVADLVVPVPAMVPGSLRPLPPSPQRNPRVAPARRPLPLPSPPAPPQTSIRSRYDGMSELIRVITTAVAPTTWEDVGGPGSIAPTETNLSLVVRQTEDVHEEIVDLLEKLRRMQDLCVVLRTRGVEVSGEFCEQHWPGPLGKTGSVVMKSAEAKSLIDQLQAKADGESTQVSDGPRMTLLNGQAVQMPIASLLSWRGSDQVLMLQSVVSDDRKNVRIHAFVVADPLQKSAPAVIGDGETVVLEVSRFLDGEDSSRRSFVLITPEIVVAEEEPGELDVAGRESGLE